MVLKILHVSDDPLPDWRVEKSALTLKKDNNIVFFAGKEPSFNYTRNIFNKIFSLNWTPKSRYQIPYEWYKIKNQLIDYKDYEIYQSLDPNNTCTNTVF